MATLDELEKRIAALEALLAPELATPKECRARTCSYYTHYLVLYNREHNGERLEHEAFHVAEEKCLEAQEAVFNWMNAHPDHDNVPEYLERRAEIWEKKVAA